MALARLKDTTVAILQTPANDSGVAPSPPVKAEIVRLKPSGPSALVKSVRYWSNWTLLNVLPPMITVALLLVVWQIAFSKPGATLPAPTVVWKEAGELIMNPFYWAGSQDIGLGWRVLTSLQRVVIGFGLAAVVGVLVGATIGQSIWAMRGLDPVFQVLRTVPPLAWLPI